MRQTQDFQDFARAYRAAHPQDVLHVDTPLGCGQDVAALVEDLARRGRAPMLSFDSVPGSGFPMMTNVFASRERIARIMGTDLANLPNTSAAPMLRLRRIMWKPARSARW